MNRSYRLFPETVEPLITPDFPPGNKLLQVLLGDLYSVVMLQGEHNPRIDRVGFELRATGVKPETPNPLRTGIHTRGYLPHVKRDGARYFTTFRLEDALPKAVFMKIKAERERRLTAFYVQQNQSLKSAAPAPDQGILDTINRDYHRQLEQYLDKSCGECWLANPAVAEIVRGALRYFEGQRYRLDAWVIMPNHVHVVLWPMPNHSLSDIMKSWKGFTARKANELLNRTNQAFWQREPFDHWIRNDLEHARCCRYVVHNPVKARLCDAPEHWRWSSAWRESPGQ